MDKEQEFQKEYAEKLPMLDNVFFDGVYHFSPENLKLLCYGFYQTGKIGEMDKAIKRLSNV